MTQSDQIPSATAPDQDTLKDLTPVFDHSQGDAASSPPKDVLRVIESINALSLRPYSHFTHVESDYYDWSLEQRAERLKAPKIDHLCKTILFENTKWKDTGLDPLDHSNPRYLLVVVQYVDKMNAQKLMNFVRDLGNKAVARKWYNMRVASEEKNREMTGFEPGGVTPFGTSKSLPIIVTENITKLDPPIIYLGAGHKDWKVCIEVKALIRSTKCFVADLQQDTPSETVA